MTEVIHEKGSEWKIEKTESKSEFFPFFSVLTDIFKK